MCIHSFLITNGNGELLLSHYEVPLNVQDKAAWETELRTQTKDLWSMAGVQCTSQVAKAAGKAQEEVIIVFRHDARAGLIFFLSGTEEHDELTLDEALGCLIWVITSLCCEGKGTLCESRLLLGEVYGKVCIAVDEVIGGGVLESLDPQHVLSMSKLRAPIPT
ncbi:unnamed protein product [Chrysoparadoxa australica]